MVLDRGKKTGEGRLAVSQSQKTEKEREIEWKKQKRRRGVSSQCKSLQTPSNHPKHRRGQKEHTRGHLGRREEINAVGRHKHTRGCAR